MGETKFGIGAIFLYIFGAIGLVSGLLGPAINQSSNGRGGDALVPISASIACLVLGFIFHGVNDAIANHQSTHSDIRTLLKYLATKDVPAGPERERIMSIGNPGKLAAAKRVVSNEKKRAKPS